jgi:hypothetical protein
MRSSVRPSGRARSILAESKCTGPRAAVNRREGQAARGRRTVRGYCSFADLFEVEAGRGSVIVNIVAFHLWLLPSGTGLSVVLLGLELFLAWAYRQAYAPLLAARSAPMGRSERVNA